MNPLGARHGMWDEEDGFYYDVLRLPDGSTTRLKVRSMVGLLPAVRRHGVRAASSSSGYPEVDGAVQWFVRPNARADDVIRNLPEPGHPAAERRILVAGQRASGCAGSSR